MTVSAQSRIIASEPVTKAALIDRPAFIVLAIISLMQPGSLSFIGLSIVDNLLTAISLVIMIYAGSFFLRRYRIPAIVCWIICYHILLALFTLLDSSPNYEEIIKTAGPAVTLCLVVWLCIKRDAERYFESASLALGLLLVINLASMILSPNGLYTTTGVVQDINYFLGFDNTFVLWTVPFVFHIAALSVIKHGCLALWTLPCFVLAFATESLTWAVTGMFTIGLEIILIIAVCTFKLRISFRSIIAISLIVFFCLIIFRVQNHFSGFFELYLDKDVSFTGRSELWDSTIEIIVSNPVFGKGISANYIYGLITQPHSFYLEVLYRGGLLLLLVVALVYFELIKASERKKGRLLVHIAVVSVGAWLICMTTDSILHKSYFWAMMVATVAISELPNEPTTRLSQRKDEHAFSL